jgi:dihydrolipoamide dehydrogenase
MAASIPVEGSDEKLAVDVAVIGSGPGGYVAAIRAGQLGKKVALIEKDRIGGVCLNIGCIPSKALITAGKLVKNVHGAGKMGIDATVTVDISKLQAWKLGVVNRLTSGVEFLCKQNHVQIIRGTARFASKNELVISQNPPAKEITLSFEYAIIATGTTSIELPSVRFDGQRIISSTEALELTTPPKSMLLIGGGVIGLEIGTAYANLFGTRLAIVELLDQLLPGTDLDLVDPVRKNLEKIGTKIYLKSKVKSASVRDGSVEVQFETSEGATERLEAEYVLVGIGRKPNTGELSLDKVGVSLNQKGFVTVNKRMQTNVPNIFAIGDVTGGLLLAHKAMKEGIVAAEVISGENSEADFQAMPAAIFTDPEISIVGLSQSQAEKSGKEILVGKFPFSASGRALASGESDGFAKVIAEKDSGIILGIEIVGHGASDLISEASLAIEMGATLDDIALTIHPHPTMPEAIMEAAENALGKAIHIPNRRSSRSAVESTNRVLQAS